MANFSFGPTGFSGSGDFRAPSNAGATNSNHRLKKFKFFNWGGATATYTIHVINDFGLSTQGGMVFYQAHNWMNERSFGIISWNNNGSGDPLSTVAIDKLYETGHTFSVSLGSNDHEIDISITGGHTNGHGHQLFVWGGR